MQTSMLKIYNELMEALDQLPYDIADVQEQLTELKLSLSDRQRHYEEHRTMLISANGGWSALGKNEGERDAALKAMLTHDKTASNTQTTIIALEREIAKQTSALDDLQRRYGAVCYKARLHSGMLNFLGSAGAPVSTPEIDFGMGSRSGNGSTQPTLSQVVNSDDAKAIGL